MKYIVVHSGARDQYKLAEALYKKGKLGYLVTDDILFRKEYKHLFPKEFIKISYCGLFVRTILKIYNFGEKLQQLKGLFLGRTAGKLSKKTGMPLIALQEYAYYAFRYSDVHPRIVFQYHPQAETNKKIFQEEINRNPSAICFQGEIKIYTPQKIKEAREELKQADYFIAASSFTKQSLVENGADPSKVFVAPYGVDTLKYPYKERKSPKHVNFIFVGSFVERKGVSYLLKAIHKLEEDGFDFNLNLISRSGVDVSVIEKSGVKNIKVYSNLSHKELIELYHSSDVFVFPSLFEGFAFVIIEAMSTGLPIITTPRTVGLDVVRNGENGFLVEPSNSDAIYEAMKYFILHPEKCVEMGICASKDAKILTWDNFEHQIIDATNIIESNY